MQKYKIAFSSPSGKFLRCKCIKPGAPVPCAALDWCQLSQLMSLMHHTSHHPTLLETHHFSKKRAAQVHLEALQKTIAT